MIKGTNVNELCSSLPNGEIVRLICKGDKPRTLTFEIISEHNKIKIFDYDSLFELVSSTDADMCDGHVCRAKFLKQLGSGITAYEQEALRTGIPEAVISKFNKWHSSHVYLIRSTIDRVFGSCFINTVKEQVAVVLGMYAFIFHLTILDAEKTLGDLNGDLNSVEYKGLKCLGTCPDCQFHKNEDN